VLLDSIGELASLFPLADVVFMGGTLARRGGHNILEPAVCARPIVVGPHMENFAAIASDFRAHGAMLEIVGAGELAGAVEKLIGDPGLRRDVGARAAELAGRRRGAATTAAAEILKAYDLAIPVWDRPGLAKPILWLLAKLWTLGGTWKQRREAAKARALGAPVVSIGGIGMGGAGKTPLVDLLARRLRERGRMPAILTRGYRRKSIADSIVVEAGGAAAAYLTGDEAQIFIRSGAAHAGIGSDRWSTGRLLEQKCPTDVFLLDDGFQHRGLERQLDIVLIDALNPFAGGAAVPLGGLREPLTALGRADAFVITRAHPGREYEGIRKQLRAANAHAPIFRASVKPLYWTNQRTQETSNAPEGLLAAFCGLANPTAFWLTLRGWASSRFFSGLSAITTATSACS